MRQLRWALTCACLCIIGAVAAATGRASGPSMPVPPPVNYDALTPGVRTLVAVMPHGTHRWVRPGEGAAAGVTSPSPGFVSFSGTGPGETASPDAIAGCSAVDNPPGFAENGDLQGSVDWTECVDVDETVDNVGMQKSGAAASFYKQNVHFGNSNWIAWSAAYTNCQFVNHSWRTVDNSEIESIYGDYAYFAGSSQYVSRYC